MICPICKTRTKKIIRIIKNIKIYECKFCRFGFIARIKKQNTKLNRNKLKILYDSKEYFLRAEQLKKRFNKLIDKILLFKKGGKTLDVGAGYALFSSILYKKGEFAIDLLEPVFLPKLRFNLVNLYKQSFENFNKNNTYDLILMIDVLEHFRDLTKSIDKVKKLLKEDGIFVVQTPNYISLMQKICKNWSWWMIEDHKSFFSTYSLKKVLLKSGFNIKFITTYEDVYDFKKNLDGNFTSISNIYLRKMIKATFYLIFWPTYIVFRKIMWRLGFGGLIFLIASKD